MSHVQQVTAATFKSDVLKSPVPVLVDLYADWCMPCRMMTPVLDQVSARLAGQLKIVKINVEQEQELAAAFGVTSIPMLVLFNRGDAVAHRVGMQTESAILQMIQPVLPGQPATR